MIRKLNVTRFVLFLAFLWGAVASAADLKMRAREHFETHNVSFEEDSTKYQGFSNTINVWWEDPYKLSYGFSFGPVLGSAKPVGDEDPRLGDVMRLFIAGFEVKYFPIESVKGLYTRGGLGWSQLRSRGEWERLDGHHVYLGLGWEFPVGKAGVALELAQRVTELQKKTSVSTFTPSLGVHFYK